MFSKNTLKRTLKLLVVVGLLVLTASIALAQDSATAVRGERGQTPRPLPAALEGLKLDTPVQVSGAAAAFRLAPDLRNATGRVQVIVRLSQPPAALAAPEATAGVAAAAVAQQASVVAAARSLDANARVLGTVRLALNAVMLEVDAAVLPQLAQNPDVLTVSVLGTRQLDLSETVPYIGATAVQEMGYDGTGVSVAVLDSGIDYTHIAFGGSGDPADWENNDPAIIEPGTFPTDKVVGGYDFVGSTWPDTDVMPDPDPLDDGVGGGHGTHVADIIGGTLGVAPGVDLYAYKVCSSIVNSCPDASIIMGIEAALDPNGDGNMSDHVDIINMSLGSNYADPRWDALAMAAENAGAAGVLTVVAAGNDSDKPYILGPLASVPSNLTVAITALPSAVQGLMRVTEPEDIAGLYPAVWQPWSAPLTDVITGPLQYGDGAGGNLLGCSLGADPNSVDPANAPFPPGSLAGKIVLVDRGACNFSIKIYNIQRGGGLAGIIGLVTPEEPFAGAFGAGGPFTIPGYMISQADSNALKSGLDEGVTIVFDPADGIPLVQHMVGYSSRGPSGLNGSKPDIGAPGESVSAEFGTGTGTTRFSGTSGATPMVAGSAALVMDAYPNRSWFEVKAVLMNTAEVDIMNVPEFFGGYPAPISRIGAGEVHVDRAVNSSLAAWNSADRSAALSFGFHEVTGQLDLIQRVTIRNYSDRAITLRSEVDYRYDNDANGEVRVTAPSWFTVPANGSTSVPVRMFIRPRLNRPLHEWALNSGSQGGNPDALTEVEYDGYIHFVAVGASSESAMIHVPWHVLPRGAGRVETGFVPQTSSGWVRNTGMAEVYIDTYSLLGSSPEMADPPLGGNAAPADLRWVGVQTYPVPAGFCLDQPSFLMGLAANTWDRYTHANNVLIEFDLDTDSDGEVDYAIYNFDATLSSNPTDGRSLTWVEDLEAGTADAWFFTQHETNSGNFVLYFCAEQIGLTAADMLTTSMDVSAYAVDWFYGSGADAIEGLNVVPLGERYYTVFANGDAGFTTLPPRSTRLGFSIIDFGDQLNETETGLLWLYGPGAPVEARTWIVQP